MGDNSTVSRAPSLQARACAGRLIAPFLLSLCATGLCYFAAGPTLGLFFGSFFVAAMIVPPLQQTAADARTIGVGVCIGDSGRVGCGLNAAGCLRFRLPQKSPGSPGLGHRAAWPGQTGACRAARRTPAVAATLLIALAWLTWPVWLTAALETSHGQTIVDLLVPAHPPFLHQWRNETLRRWDHYPALAYPTLTVLNQDVSYRQPTSIFPAVLLHAALGLAFLLPSAKAPPRRAGFIPPGRVNQ